MIIRHLNYEPYKFSAPAPENYAPTDFPLPWHETIMRTKEIHDEDRRFRQRHAEEVQRPKGFFGKLDTSVQRQKHKVNKRHDKHSVGSERKDHKKKLYESLKRFRVFFKYPATEQLWLETDCKAVHKDGQLKVSLFISTNYVSLVHESKRLKQSLYISIPLKHLVSLQHAQTVPKFGEAPLIQRLFDPTSKFNAIQLYAEDGHIHLLHDFDDIKAKTVFNVLDKCWRASFMPQQIYAPQFPGEPPRSPYDAIFRGNYPDEELDDEHVVVGYPGQYGVLQCYGISPANTSTSATNQIASSQIPSSHLPTLTRQNLNHSYQVVNNPQMERVSISVDSTPLNLHVKKHRSKSMNSSRSFEIDSNNKIRRKKTINQHHQPQIQQFQLVDQQQQQQQQQQQMQEPCMTQTQGPYIESDSSSNAELYDQNYINNNASTSSSTSGTRMVIGPSQPINQTTTTTTPIPCYNQECNVKGFCSNQECCNNQRCMFPDTSTTLHSYDDCCTNQQCNTNDCTCVGQNCLNNSQCVCSQNCICKSNQQQQQQWNQQQQQLNQQQQQLNQQLLFEDDEEEDEILGERPFTTAYIPPTIPQPVPLQPQQPLTSKPPLFNNPPPLLTQHQPKPIPVVIPLQPQQPLSSPPNLTLNLPPSKTLYPQTVTTSTLPIQQQQQPISIIEGSSLLNSSSIRRQSFQKQSSFYNQKPVVFDPHTHETIINDQVINEPISNTHESFTTQSARNVGRSRSQSTSRSTSQQTSPSSLRNQQQQAQQQFLRSQQLYNQQHQQSNYSKSITNGQDQQQDQQQDQFSQQDQQQERRGSYELKRDELKQDQFNANDYKYLHSSQSRSQSRNPSRQQSRSQSRQQSRNVSRTPSRNQSTSNLHQSFNQQDQRQQQSWNQGNQQSNQQGNQSGQQQSWDQNNQQQQQQTWDQQSQNSRSQSRNQSRSQSRQQSRNSSRTPSRNQSTSNLHQSFSQQSLNQNIQTGNTKNSQSAKIDSNQRSQTGNSGYQTPNQTGYQTPSNTPASSSSSSLANQNPSVTAPTATSSQSNSNQSRNVPALEKKKSYNVFTTDRDPEEEHSALFPSNYDSDEQEESESN